MAWKGQGFESLQVHQIFFSPVMNTVKPVRVAAVLLLAGAVATMALFGWEYRRQNQRFRGLYTGSVKKRDISDTARRAISALQDAELQTQLYVLTGETAYSEAYADDLMEWDDEFGTLQIVARHDPGEGLAKDLSRTATRVMDELAALVALQDKGAHDAAIERLRKGSAIVYLEQSRKVIAQFQEVDGHFADETDQALINGVMGSQRRFLMAAGFLFCIAAAGTLLVLRLKPAHLRPPAAFPVPARQYGKVQTEA
jgi:CHASE3 domain sensor protein